VVANQTSVVANFRPAWSQISDQRGRKFQTSLVVNQTNVVENQTNVVGNQTNLVANQTNVGLTSASVVENYLVPNPKLFQTNTFKSVLVGNIFETSFYSKYHHFLFEGKNVIV
jgi:hypothetical protein